MRVSNVPLVRIYLAGMEALFGPGWMILKEWILGEAERHRKTPAAVWQDFYRNKYRNRLHIKRFNGRVICVRERKNGKV